MIFIYNINTIKNIDIKYPDIYFTPEYGECCEYSDNSIWELCKYKDLIFVYLKKKINNYIQIITPYGYGGIYYEKYETYNDFFILFKDYCNKNNIKKIIIRQNPYININLNNLNILKSKKIYYIKVSNINDYINHIHKSAKNKINKSIKLNLKYTIEKTDIKTLSNNSIFINCYT
jgi:hypothetical protein